MFHLPIQSATAPSPSHTRLDAGANRAAGLATLEERAPRESVQPAEASSPERDRHDRGDEIQSRDVRAREAAEQIQVSRDDDARLQLVQSRDDTVGKFLDAFA